MKKLLIKLFVIIIFLSTTNCGFKTIDKENIKNFKVQEIKTTGNKRINYKIKNYLLSNSIQDNNNNLIIKLKTDKKKIIKEKNIKNEITKYQVKIIVKVMFIEVGKNEEHKLTLSKSGNYDIGAQHSQTLNNEKNLIKLLTNNISEQILEELSGKLNDI